jgi:hypothetical protein
MNVCKGFSQEMRTAADGPAANAGTVSGNTSLQDRGRIRTGGQCELPMIPDALRA